MDWINALQQAKANATACVLISITNVDGSAPRSIGARMVVTMDNQFDTIGGGNLEYTAIAQARALLVADNTSPRNESQQHILGKALSQCCGGRVTLQYDVVPAAQLRLVVFGAGHVAAALAGIVAQLPWHVTFYDSRESRLKQINTASIDAGVIKTSHLGSNPFFTIEQCPDNAFYLVMTHDHALDYDLVEAILTRGDSRYCGLIASRSKAMNFRKRLQRKGFTAAELEQLTAPIGDKVQTGNTPMEVAVAAVADVLSCSHKSPDSQGSPAFKPQGAVTTDSQH